jgi:adenylate cyclase
MRYLKATFLLGLASSLIVLALTLAGFLTVTPDIVLRKALGLEKAAGVPLGGLITVFVILAFAAAWTTIDITRPLLKAVVALGAVVLIFTFSATLSLYQFYFSPFPAAAAVLCSYGLGLAFGRTRAGKRKKTIERMFYQRVPRSDFSQLLNSGASTDFPGELVEGTVLVCEVQNHREIMEFLTPSDYASMTNLYLQTASDYLVEVGGYLDECTGESLRVVFGAPVRDEKHAMKACRAALDLLSRLDILNKECDATWQRRFDFRIGLNSGEMVGGAYGGLRLSGYSVAGSAVEFARRLCAACGTYGCRILVGPDTFEMAQGGFEVRPIEFLKSLGDRRRVELYEILAPKHGLSPERERSRDHFWRGVLFFREKKWDKALEELQQARITGIPDPALDFYIRRVERARHGGEDDREQSLLFAAESV